MTILKSAACEGPQTHALILGVGAYRHLRGGSGTLLPDSMGLKQLSSPPLSARAIANWMLTRFNNPDAPLGSVELLVSPSGPFALPGGDSVEVETATLVNIENAFSRWWTLLDNHEQNVALFYFCGHGVQKGDELALLTEDFGANPRRPFATAIDFHTSYLGMRRCKARLQCYFIDSCRQVPVSVLNLLEIRATELVEPLLRTPASTLNAPILYATAYDDSAYGMENQKTVFTDALLQGLNGLASEWERDSGRWVVTMTRLAETVERILEQAGQQRRIPPQECKLGGEFSRAVLHLPPGPPVDFILGTPLDFNTFLEEKRKNFDDESRGWLFDEIRNWAGKPEDRALLITGDPGIGKSSLIAQWIHRQGAGPVLAYHCCRADMPATLRPDRFVISLAGMIARKFEAYAARLSDRDVEASLADANLTKDPANAFEAAVLSPLASIAPPPSGVHYLLVDALDEASTSAKGRSERTIVDVLATCLGSLPAWIRLVITSRKDSDVLEQFRGVRTIPLDASDARNLHDIDRYITRRLDGAAMARELTTSKRRKDDVRALLQTRSAGNFLYIKHALDGIERGLYSFDGLDALPPGLFGLFREFFRRQFSDESAYEPVRRVLQMLVSARDPLSEEQIAQGAELEPEVQLPRVLRRLDPYLRRWDDRVSLYHRSLAEWLSDRDSRGSFYYASPKQGHDRLAKICAAEYQAGNMSDFTLRHFPTHLFGSADWDGLANLLCDPRFLEAKTERGMVFDLARDFETARDSIPLDHARGRLVRLLEEALRRDIQFVARHPSTLFQCLWNSCWWYDCPQAAKHYHFAADKGVATPPWLDPKRDLSTLLETWRHRKEQAGGGFRWVRCLRPPPLHLGTAQRAIFMGHADEVSCVAFTPDGQRLVSGSNDKTIRVWDVQGGRELRCLRGHEGAIQCVAIAPDGWRVASGTVDRRLWVWSLEEETAPVHLRGHKGAVFSVAFSGDSLRIVSASADGTVRVWDVGSRTEVAQLSVPGGTVRSVTFLAGDELVAMGASNGVVGTWEWQTGKQVGNFPGHTKAVRSVASSRSGHCLVSGAADCTVRFWDRQSAREIACFKGHSGRVNAVALSPDGNRLASGGDDDTIRLWCPDSGLNPFPLTGHDLPIRGLAFSPDGKLLASASVDGTVRLWDAQGGAETLLLQNHRDSVDSLAFSSDGSRVASGSADTMIHVWDVATGTIEKQLKAHQGPVRCVAFSPQGRYLGSGGDDETIRVWDGHTFEELSSVQESGCEIMSIAFSPDEAALASASFAGEIRTRELHSPFESVCLGRHEGLAVSLAYAPDGRSIVSASVDRTARIWDAERGGELFRLPSEVDWLDRIAFYIDGRRIVGVSSSGRVIQWDIGSRSVVTESGIRDVLAIAGGAIDYPWQVVSLPFETRIESAVTGQTAAWFPTPFPIIVTQRRGQTWAGASRNHVFLFTLEGVE